MEIFLQNVADSVKIEDVPQSPVDLQSVMKRVCNAVVELLTTELPDRSRHKVVLYRALLGKLSWIEVQLLSPKLSRN